MVDDATVTLSDADAVALDATVLSAIGAKTTGVVTVTNAVVISGTASQVTAALVTAESLVVAAAASINATGASGSQAHDLFELSTSGITTVSILDSYVSGTSLSIANGDILDIDAENLITALTINAGAAINVNQAGEYYLDGTVFYWYDSVASSADSITLTGVSSVTVSGDNITMIVEI